MDNNTLKLFQQQIGYTFNNTDLLEQAFTRRSYSKQYGGQDNEVLEFIGDKVLDFIVVKTLVKKYGSFSNQYKDFNPREDYNEFISHYSEGKLTEIKKKLICKKMLSKRIRILGFQYSLITGTGEDGNNVYENDSVMEDLFEAIIGAVALDSNWNIDSLTTVVDLMLNPNHYLDNGFDDENDYVLLVQQWYQKRHNRIPIYDFPKMRSWRMETSWPRNGDIQCNLYLPVNDDYWELFEGLGNSNSEARMAAAKKAYEYLEENNLLFTLVDEVGQPDYDRAVNQLQELYQKGYIGKPWYRFSETHDNNGNPIWRCECHIEGEDEYYGGNHSSKKVGKKSTAYDMLCDILDWEGDDEA